MIYPPKNSRVWDLVSTDQVEEFTARYNRHLISTFRETVSNAKKYMAKETACREIHALVLRADDSVWLIRIGPRGGWNMVWDFGKIAA